MDYLPKFAIVSVAAILMCFPAQAGDKALADIVGYSQDARYFAFEEFGIQDGSGFAFSSYYIVDLKEDRWVVGTPVRIVGEEDREPLAEIRARSAEMIRPHLENLAINLPAQSLASNGDGAPRNDGQILAFGLPLYTGPTDVIGDYTLKISHTQVAAAAPCADWFESEALGFALEIEDHGVAREIHNDKTLPRSRGCPMAYRISEVFAPFHATDISHTVALISVFTHGFEGPDRRFLAVPLAFSSH